MGNKKRIGEIIYLGNKYEVFWEIDTKLVWCVDEKGYSTHYNNAKSETQDSVLECARDMLISAGN